MRYADFLSYFDSLCKETFINTGVKTRSYKVACDKGNSVFTIDIPGVPKEKVAVSIKGTDLLVEVNGEKYNLFCLEDDDVEKVEAAVRDGQLIITLPKKAEEQNATRAIPIQ